MEKIVSLVFSCFSFLHAQIPLARTLGAKVEEISGAALILSAPVEAERATPVPGAA